MTETLIRPNPNEVKTAVETVGLKKRTLTIDVNGTLIPDDLAEEAILDPQLLAEFQREVGRLQTAGWDVGLNSDSPWGVLVEFAARLGLPADCPIIAEGGNVVSKGDKGILFRELEDRDTIIAAMDQIAAHAGYRRMADTTSPEFGGEQPDFTAHQYAYGRGRLTSISLFSNPQLTKLFQENRDSIVPPGCSADFSPEYGFTAIHPGENYRNNKGQTMSMLAESLQVQRGVEPGRLVHIGNSGSDWTDPETGVETYFVGGPDQRIKDYMRTSANTSDLPTIAGVIDILKRIQ